jgi:predicted dinucleotide-binding enzyme
MRVGIIGSGTVATTLAAGFASLGHETVIGSRTPSKLAEWGQKNPLVKVGTFEEAAAASEVVVLAVKGSGAREALETAGASRLQDKVVIDATNPLGDTPPVNGVLSSFTPQGDSLMEQLQRAFPGARLVKAFNSVGADLMVNPQLPGGPPTMFICGNDQTAKQLVSGILRQFGWDVADMGSVEAARAIEPLVTLWCIPGLLHNEWAHAFKLLRQ